MVDEIIDRSEVLVEALPYIRQFSDKIVVIKYGGNAMEAHDLRESFAIDIVLLKYMGMRPVVVHGGGPQIGETLKTLGKESEFVEGLRVTDDQTMEVVEMILGGKVNGEIVGLINKAGGQGVGLTGSDGDMFKVERKVLGGRDIGRVGNVRQVNSGPVLAVADSGYIPVVAPIGVDGDGITHNINADEAAGALACSLGAEKLVLLTDVEGVLDSGGNRISRLSVAKALALIDDGTADGGMIPKISCCVDALGGGVKGAHIIDGRLPHAILLEMLTDSGVGTLFFH